MFTSADFAGYNTLSAEENGGHFADDIYTSFSPGEYLYSSLIGYCSLQSNWKVDTGLGNGLMPNRRQALI